MTSPVVFGQMVAKYRCSNGSSHVLNSQGDYHIGFEHRVYILSGKPDQSCSSPEEVFYKIIIEGGQIGYG